MSAHVLFNFLNELRKMRGLPSILSLFCNEFNKFNNTGVLCLIPPFCVSAQKIRGVLNFVDHIFHDKIFD